MKNKHLLKLLDLDSSEIIEILNLGDQLKYEQKHNISHSDRLQGKVLGMVFQKASTRTRISFEVGIYQLGGTALFLSPKDLQIGRGESVRDTARVLSRYIDGLMIRTYEQDEVEDFAKYGSIPVINGLTDFAHPCQVLADLMTIREHKYKLEGLKAAFLGDGINMANSLIAGCLKSNMHISVATPKGYEPHPDVLEVAKEYGDKFKLTTSVDEASKDADVLITDVWTSMGQEQEAADRKKAFEGFQINDRIMSIAKSDAIVLHCLPAHKGEEITEEIFEANAGVIFDEAENRLHAQKAVMSLLM